jgi:hypothetical protein
LLGNLRPEPELSTYLNCDHPSHGTRTIRVTSTVGRGRCVVGDLCIPTVAAHPSGPYMRGRETRKLFHRRLPMVGDSLCGVCGRDSHGSLHTQRHPPEDFLATQPERARRSRECGGRQREAWRQGGREAGRQGGWGAGRDSETGRMGGREAGRGERGGRVGGRNARRGGTGEGEEIWREGRGGASGLRPPNLLQHPPRLHRRGRRGFLRVDAAVDPAAVPHAQVPRRRAVGERLAVGEVEGEAEAGDAEHVAHLALEVGRRSGVAHGDLYRGDGGAEEIGRDAEPCGRHGAADD